MFRLFVCVYLLFWGATSLRAANPLVDQLLRDGVRCGGDVKVLLPPPSMPDGLSASEQEEVIADIAARYPREVFLRPSIVAPFVLQIRSVEADDGTRTGQTVDLWFVAHGKLQQIAERGLFEDLIGVEGSAGKRGSRAAQARPLSAEQRAARNLETVDTPELGTQFYAFRSPLLDRVQLQGVAHASVSRTSRSLTGGVRIDPRFNGDAQLPNQWRPLRRAAGGQRQAGDPQPYSHFGGYAKATQLEQPAEAIFIECHVVFDEPRDWFGGVNMLRSKLPLVIQDNVRSFRRALAKSSR